MFGTMTPAKAPLVSASILADAQMQETKRLDRIATAWSRYDGQYPQPLEKTPTDPKAEDNTTVNLARRTVDISAFYLFGKECEFVVGGEEETPEDEWLRACWDASKKMTLLMDMGISGGVAGDAYLRLYPANPLLGQTYPRIVCVSAENVSVDTQPDDCTVVRRFKIEFTSVDVEAAQVTRHRHLIEREEGGGQQSWLIREQVSVGDDTRWTDVGDEEVWPYPFAPIFHCQNRPYPHCYYGCSDLEDDVLRLNHAINFVLSNVNRILRVHGHPLTYGTGAGADEIDRAVDAFLWLPNPDGRIENVEMVTELKSHFEQLQRLRDAFHELTSIPEIATGKVDNIGQLSGLALQILYGPLTQLTMVKRTRYGEMLVEVCKALLVIGGKAKSMDAADVSIQWPQILPTNRKEEADTAIVLKEAGVSQKTTLQELGYDPEQEAELRETEEADAAERMLRAFDRGQGKSGAPGTYPSAGANGKAGGSGGSDNGMSADELGKRANAAGILIRSGFEPADALRAVGLDPIQHLGLLPVTLQDNEE